jgi:glycosyltransferase involved in cell wall biosynthesis
VRSPREKSGSTLAVVIPAYNAEPTIRGCLDALGRSDRRPDEIILFDDGSTDSTAPIARAAGATVIRKGPARRGPARGRNIGADAASGSIIVFVDADVAVHPEALGRLETPLLCGDADASFGSYDDRPRSRRLAALYANLRHHWVHQHGRREAFTFWSGLGAIRADTFRALNGFDERFTEPSIEDIDLGIRILENGGRIRLVKNALGTHHKDWGILQLWKTDIARRAIPWALLIGQGRGRADDLNISIAERASAVAAHLVLIAAVITTWRPDLWPGLVCAVAAYLSLNIRFLAFLFRSGGLRAGIAGTILHWCYHIYASATFAVVATLFPRPKTRKRIMTATAGSTHATRP